MNQPQLTYIESMDIIGGLSKPSKMPWHGWSTSAFDCQTGTKLREVKGSVCSDCYACKGNYRFKNVTEAHARRLAGLANPRFEDAMVTVITALYLRTKQTYNYNGKVIKENRFRWHDSGDIQSLAHLEMVNRIALRLPYIDFWLPTKEAGYVSQFLKKHKVADNLTIRLSHPMIGETFKKKPNGLNFSTVGAHAKTLKQCPASTQGNKCLDCRNCWNKSVDAVNYPLH